MTFEDFLKTISKDELKKIPERIAIFYFVDTNYYHSLIGDV